MNQARQILAFLFSPIPELEVRD